MSLYTERIIKEIKEEKNENEIVEFFNSNTCGLTKAEFCEILNEFILYPNHDILRIILKSKKFKSNNDCVNSYGEPVVHAILYAIEAICEADGIQEIRKIEYKEALLSILLDEDIDLNWDMLDVNNDTPLHIILAIHDYFTIKELNKLVNAAINHGVNPLNRNIFDENSFDTLMETSFQNESDKENILKKLASSSDNFMIEVKSSVYC